MILLPDFVPNGKSEDAINLYVNMPNDLKRMYGITNEVSNNDINSITNMIKSKNYKAKKRPNNKVFFLFFVKNIPNKCMKKY